MKRDLNKERADLQKRIGYLMMDPARSDEERLKVLEKLEEIVKILSPVVATSKKN